MQVRKGLRHTFKTNRNLLGRNDFHRNRLLIRIQIQLRYPRPQTTPLKLLITVILSSTPTLSPLAGQYGVEFARRGRRFRTCFFLLLGFGVEAR